MHEDIDKVTHSSISERVKKMVGDMFHIVVSQQWVDTAASSSLTTNYCLWTLLDVKGLRTLFSRYQVQINFQPNRPNQLSIKSTLQSAHY